MNQAVFNYEYRFFCDELSVLPRSPQSFSQRAAVEARRKEEEKGERGRVGETTTPVNKKHKKSSGSDG